MTHEIRKRSQSPIREVRNQARVAYKKALAAAEQKGYERGIRAALKIAQG